MIIKCTELGNGNWLKINKFYHVMTVLCSASGLDYRIITSDDEVGFFSMGLFPAEHFEIVSTYIPSNWNINIYTKGAVSVGPAAWHEANFYENFYDGDPEVYPIFERERNIIRNEEPYPGIEIKRESPTPREHIGIYDVVTLAVDIDDKTLLKGTMGIVRNIYNKPNNPEEFYEVEFFEQASGNTLITLSLHRDFLHLDMRVGEDD